ncbi:hypothetical protein H257_17388 [Aphanomyces astaci]|uniref:AB hydrolase-1 domain-containing protein n=1 Tax=Aphanomyces astaci TaxID=112090 RepID=W4FF51_APHAT|nr:hypothetical protein, variant [Aphanomyces astaci]XP_009844485.1 hypothetical protein H257_17388 [Aphanomyces astaci]ETV66055.1 hypothetical protein H257_17388 [Aphanomyces astaci]ETV66056.1 hypothetical protein, variant [Aphanomyces astaci]|eukprot:XP_009844484.1 hypothetical protein, variant [Aphanomyces astaci]
MVLRPDSRRGDGERHHMDVLGLASRDNRGRGGAAWFLECQGVHGSIGPSAFQRLSRHHARSAGPRRHVVGYGQFPSRRASRPALRVPRASVGSVADDPLGRVQHGRHDQRRLRSQVPRRDRVRDPHLSGGDHHAQEEPHVPRVRTNGRKPHARGETRGFFPVARVHGPPPAEKRRDVLEKLMRDILLDASVLDDKLAKITHPCLVVWGDQDKILDISCLEVIKDKIKPQLTVKVVADAGHIVHQERHWEVAEHVHEFLQALPPSTSSGQPPS